MSSYEDVRVSQDPRGGEAHGMPSHLPQSSHHAPPPGYGYAPQWEMRPRRIYPIETKPFFLTSEFVGAVLAVLGIAITAASSTAFGAWRAWILITAVVIGYMVSRGIGEQAAPRVRPAVDIHDPDLDCGYGRGLPDDECSLGSGQESDQLLFVAVGADRQFLDQRVERREIGSAAHATL